MDLRAGWWRKLSAEELMLVNCGVREDSWESLGLQGDPTSPSWRRSVLGVHWKDRCWSWNSTTLATSCEVLTHWKRPWWWEGLGAGGEGDDRGWDSWMASPILWTWIWVNSGSWWWTGRPGVLRFMRSQRVRHNWVTELNWPVNKHSHFSQIISETWYLALVLKCIFLTKSKEQWNSLEPLLTRAQISLTFHPKDLITSQSPHLLILSYHLGC